MPDWKALPPLDLADGRNQELIDHKRWWGSAVRRFNGDHSGQQYSNQKLRRLSTFWWLLCLNAALFRSTGRGLRRFASLATPLLDASSVYQKDDDAHQAEPGLDFKPTLTICLDQCSVGWSAMCFMLYSLRLRVVPIFDPSHRFLKVDSTSSSNSSSSSSSSSSSRSSCSRSSCLLPYTKTTISLKISTKLIE
jgi:hypothetical protein